MLVGLVDVDNFANLEGCFPNIPLMKLSTWHKNNGDIVEWHNPSKHYDLVYMSKVFSFSPYYPFDIDADEIRKGGSGYAIRLENGKEIFDETKNNELPYEVEHSFPDYGLYGITDTAYGFMSRGCPRGCDFCHVKRKEGLKSRKVADLHEFWNGQKNIELLDPNTLACSEWRDILQQLIDSKAWVDFNQGVDIRLMTDEKAEMLRRVKIKHIHFAYDRYQDKKIIEPKFELFKETTGWGRSKVSVYVLTNFDTTLEQDLDRIYFLRNLGGADNGFQPYVMRYNKENIPRGSAVNQLSRWVNFKPLFWKYKTFEEYLERNGGWEGQMTIDEWMKEKEDE